LADGFEGFGVDPAGWFLVGLDQTGRIEPQIFELAFDARFFEGGNVDFAEFAPRGVEIPPEAVGRFLGVAPVGRTATEQLRIGIELLVELESGDESQLLVVVVVFRAHCGPCGSERQKSVQSSAQPSLSLRAFGGAKRAYDFRQSLSELRI